MNSYLDLIYCLILCRSLVNELPQERVGVFYIAKTWNGASFSRGEDSRKRNRFADETGSCIQMYVRV